MLTVDQERIHELEEIVWGIDFTCRAMKDPSDAVQLTHKLCHQVVQTEVTPEQCVEKYHVNC